MASAAEKRIADALARLHPALTPEPGPPPATPGELPLGACRVATAVTPPTMHLPVSPTSTLKASPHAVVRQPRCASASRASTTVQQTPARAPLREDPARVPRSAPAKLQPDDLRSSGHAQKRAATAQRPPHTIAATRSVFVAQSQSSRGSPLPPPTVLPAPSAPPPAPSCEQ
eukprot:1474787-Prymnesium_polylepis.1